MEKALVTYYRRAFSNGRSVIAQIFDIAFLIFVLSFAGYLYFRGIKLVTYVSLALGIITGIMTTIIYFIVRNTRYEQFVSSERKKIAREIALCNILTMPYNEFVSLSKNVALKNSNNPETTIAIQNASELSADSVLCIYKNAKSHGDLTVTLATANKLSTQAYALIEKLEDVSFVVMQPKELTDSTMKQISEEQIDMLITKREESRQAARHKKFGGAFGESRVLPYFYLGGALIIASFFVRFSLYYKLLAGLCFSVGITISTMTLYKKNHQN